MTSKAIRGPGRSFIPSESDLREAARDKVAGEYSSFAGQYSAARQALFLQQQLERRATAAATATAAAAATVAPCPVFVLPEA